MTLSSDLGTAYAAQMKAVLLHDVPPERIVDLTHDLRPHAIAEAAFVLARITARFPAGAVHVVVVDPGVGGRRRAIVLACRDGTLLVGPDNGVLPPLAAERGGGRAYALDPPRLGSRPRVGTTFDGRDVFAPAAARLAGGARPEELGAPVTPVRLPGPPPRRLDRGARGVIAHIDRFGNLVTDVPTDWLPRHAERVVARLGRSSTILPVRRSYEEAGPGAALLLGSSFGTLEVAVAEGRAHERWPLRLGAPVRFGWRRAGPSARRKRK